MKPTTFALSAIVAAVVLTFGTPPALARPGAGGPLAAFDPDGDGAITRAEAEAQRLARFLRFDSNGDGSVTQAEMELVRQARHERRQGRAFARLDTDGDGALSAAEFGALPMRAFEKADKDGDGIVSAVERAAVASEMMHRRGRWRDRGLPEDPVRP